MLASIWRTASTMARSTVVISGVKVGRVTHIELAPDLRARVTLDVDAKLELPVDTSASIRTAGLLGDQFIELEPGAEDKLLASGDEISLTESALSNPKFADAVLPRIPARRWGQIDDFGGIAVYLASDASAYTTGEQFVIDGGYTKF